MLLFAAVQRSFKKKGHEQQYKHNKQLKNTMEQTKEAVQTRKYDVCIKKLDEGTELVEQRQKLILMADRSEYGWKTVGEYIDNELADDDEDEDEDAKKMKIAEKEAQRKLAETRANKMARGRGFWYRKAPRVTATSTHNQYNAPMGNTTPQAALPMSNNRGAYPGGYGRRPGLCFGCGKQGHWRSECPLATLADGQQQGGRKLSTFDYEFISTAQPDNGEVMEGDGMVNGEESQSDRDFLVPHQGANS